MPLIPDEFFNSLCGHLMAVIAEMTKNLQGSLFQELLKGDNANE